ncbi:hypothetical protein OQX61_22215 [Pedobacter sp. PLR]|uniref:hypothetical protein n=1 Tax=Pedobacter sp. PLR TaxID=2994465 RepID=UPI002245700C|nr:hypothetical protein [Pedobacter sp. PLR]MCX2454000.1 hypothetical protein [Pedobacter sp. PLR]
MVEQEGIYRIERLQKQWTVLLLFRILILSLGLTLILGALMSYLFDWPVWAFVALFLIIFCLLSWLKPFWKVSSAQICRYLNEKYPELEESAALLLKPAAACSRLERLQQHKISQVIIDLSPAPKPPFQKLARAAVVMTLGIAMSLGFSFLKPLTGAEASAAAKENVVSVKEKVLPEIASFSLLIKAPAYTGVPERTQTHFAFKAENGALLKWNIRTSMPAKVLKLIFNDKEVAVLKSQDGEGKVWTFLKTISKPGFYQVELDGKKSELYMMTILPDLPAVIKITRPEPHTSIDYGQAQQVRLNVSLTDDYGLKAAYVSATMASGKGEGVSFTEKKLDFREQFANRKSMSLTKLIDLRALGMKPGDELYFFVTAFDNLGQMSRSDVYFVSIVDTAELMSMAGMTNGVNLVPEYFRSQRQIIIDTEKLLADKNTISGDTFKSRSNELGMDQKLLRLRYGKFLGEESETEIGAGHDHNEGEKDDDHEQEAGKGKKAGKEHQENEEHEGHQEGKEIESTAKFGDVKAIMDSYAHKHDIAEDATFFEPELKAQLKAVLTEMWKSELQLRTYKTRDALPFEYKALRLLKDLQQKSRAYVAKTTVKVTQLKEEKRLSGELDKIGSPVQKSDFEPQEKRQLLLKQVLGVLENRKAAVGVKSAGNLKYVTGFSNGERQLLKETEQYMVISASAQPELFLPALAAGRKILSEKGGSEKDLALLQKAILNMLGPVQITPQLPVIAPASTLGQKYFNHLKKAARSNGI